MGNIVSVETLHDLWMASTPGYERGLMNMREHGNPRPKEIVRKIRMLLEQLWDQDPYSHWIIDAILERLEEPSASWNDGNDYWGV